MFIWSLSCTSGLKLYQNPMKSHASYFHYCHMVTGQAPIWSMKITNITSNDKTQKSILNQLIDDQILILLSFYFNTSDISQCCSDPAGTWLVSMWLFLVHVHFDLALAYTYHFDLACCHSLHTCICISNFLICKALASIYIYMMLACFLDVALSTSQLLLFLPYKPIAVFYMLPCLLDLTYISQYPPTILLIPCVYMRMWQCARYYVLALLICFHVLHDVLHDLLSL